MNAKTANGHSRETALYTAMVSRAFATARAVSVCAYRLNSILRDRGLKWPTSWKLPVQSPQAQLSVLISERGDRRGCTRLWSGEIQQHHVRALLHSFEDKLAAIWGDVEVANAEVGSEVGQLPLDTRLQVDEPEILMLNLSSQE
jgi:hypothetical protein